MLISSWTHFVIFLLHLIFQSQITLLDLPVFQAIQPEVKKLFIFPFDFAYVNLIYHQIVKNSVFAFSFLTAIVLL